MTTSNGHLAPECKLNASNAKASGTFALEALLDEPEEHRAAVVAEVRRAVALQVQDVRAVVEREGGGGRAGERGGGARGRNVRHAAAERAQARHRKRRRRAQLHLLCVVGPQAFP